MFEVLYELDNIPGPKIESVRVMDGDYKAVGPNLTYLFDKMFFLVSDKEGTPFLSMVADQLAVTK